MPKVTFLPMREDCEFQEGETLLDLAIRCDVPLNHSCEGMGTCGTCRVFVEEGAGGLSPRNEIEAERAEDMGYEELERLSCQNLCVDGLIVRIPKQT